jgi:nucleotide-binding universal stress UspA family protein
MPEPRFARILCPVDFSEFSARALDHALRLAEGHESEVTVLYVTPVSAYAALGAEGAYFRTDLPAPETLSDARQHLAQFVERRAGPTSRAHQLVREGDPAGQIVVWAEQYHADLIVMGTHGLSGLRRMLMGSVTEKVLRRAPCPVMSVCHEDEARVAAAGFRHVLVPVSLEGAEPGLGWALDIARASGATISALHVVEGMPDPTLLQLRVPFDPEAYRADLHAAVSKTLEERLARLPAAGVPLQPKIAFGKAYAEILRVAGDERADLIVMGVHNRGPLDLFFFGSTANHVVRMAHCPVLTVRPGYAKAGSQAA